MTPEETKKLIKEGEGERLEFKENFDKETIETAVAFANKNGGVILIGVNDRKEIKGIRIEKETLRNWINEISQSTEPTLIPEIESFEIANKKIVYIKIVESPIKPACYKGICYLRIGNSNKKLTPKEIAEFHLQTTGSSWDSYPAENAKLEDIDLKKVEEYIKLANETGRRKIQERPLATLKKLELIKDNKPTWAAILLFGEEPQKYVLQSKVHCGRFKSDTVIIDDATVEGTLIDQVDNVLEFIKKNINIRFEFTGEARRKEIWDYPLDAIREAIINALCHRDYNEISETEVRIYDNELIIWSPGKLPLGINLKDLFKQHKSVLRNKLIAQVFFDIAFIEAWGTGINRMIKACTNQDLPKPEFEEYQGFKITFRKDPFTEEHLKSLDLNERQIKAVMYAKENGRITNKEYQKINSVSRQTASRELSELAQKNILEQIGVTGKGTFYIATQTPHKRLTNAPAGGEK